MSPTDVESLNIDWRAEAMEVIRLKGLRTTPMGKLQEAVGYGLLNCPEELRPIFEALLLDVSRRRFYMEQGL